MAAVPGELSPQTVRTENEKSAVLLSEMLAGRLVEIRPQFDFPDRLGISYPSAEQILGVSGDAATSILESLLGQGLLKRSFVEKVISCPQCHSINLRPSIYCPKCGSGNMVRGRIIQHVICKYAGTEEEFLVKDRYVCPKCHMELRTSGADYQSLGVLRKCLDCEGVFGTPAIRWTCGTCSAISAEDKVNEVNAYSYCLDEASRGLLEFETQPKRRLIEFLRRRGYEVLVNARVRGRSGAEHTIDILATRDDGVVSYSIAIGVEVAGNTVTLEKVFAFDDKAYDAGINDKVLIVSSALQKEAERFAGQQRIKVVQTGNLESVLVEPSPAVEREISAEPFELESKSQLQQHLLRLGYRVQEDVALRGKSGAEHKLDMLASSDEGLVSHNVAIGIQVDRKPVELAAVFDFDDIAYDVGILNKAFIAVPGLTREARRFAQRQRIRVFEVKQVEPSA